MKDEEYEDYEKKNCGKNCPVNRIIRYYEKGIVEKMGTICRFTKAFSETMENASKEIIENAMKDEFVEGLQWTDRGNCTRMK